jgi:xylulose-5-phosphate/fructose-6-phosphate phosphoketolase
VELVVDRSPKLASMAAYIKQAVGNKLIEHRHYIAEHGVDMPEISDWTWPGN